MLLVVLANIIVTGLVVCSLVQYLPARKHKTKTFHVLLASLSLFDSFVSTFRIPFLNFILLLIPNSAF